MAAASRQLAVVTSTVAHVLLYHGMSEPVDRAAGNSMPEAEVVQEASRTSRLRAMSLEILGHDELVHVFKQLHTLELPVCRGGDTVSSVSRMDENGLLNSGGGQIPYT